MAAHGSPELPSPHSTLPRFRDVQQARLVRSLRVTLQQASNSDNATQRLETALDVLDEKLSEKIDGVKDALTAFQQSLPDSFMPRRESMEIITGIRGQVGDLNTRLTAMEEWRLAETKAAGLANAALEAKIAQAVMQAMRDNNATAQTAQQAVATDRQTTDARTITLFQAIIFLLISTGLSVLVMVVWNLIQHTSFH